MALSFFDFEYFRSQGRFTQQRAPYFTYIFLLIENITRDAKHFIRLRSTPFTQL